jgi:dihydrofolate reductase
MHAFVICEQAPKPDDIVPGFTFVTGGIEAALDQARHEAGDKDVWVMGGANIAQQFVKAGLLDELHISIAPVLFTGGRRLFENLGDTSIELEALNTVQTPQATHIAYRVKK